MLVLRDNPEGFMALGPEDIQSVIERYKAWSDGLRKAGRLSGGEKLADGQGHVMRRDQGRVRVTDGPFAEAREVLGGFFLVDAPDYDAAIALAQDCPHLEFGSIEVREVEQV